MDPIADMLTRIRNAQAVNHQSVELPYSNLNFELARILKKENYIENVIKRGKAPKRRMEIVLKYDNSVPAVSGLTRISRPGRRVYLKKDKLYPVRQGWGIAVISTSKGLMTDKEARKAGLGGEVLCQVW